MIIINNITIVTVLYDFKFIVNKWRTKYIKLTL